MNRRSQNQALRDFNELATSIETLRPFIMAVLVRASGDSDLRRSVNKKGDSEQGTPPPYYADPTGEIAMRRQFADAIELKVKAMAEHLHYALNLAKSVLDITPPDVAERAKREVPDCLACGHPAVGKIQSGYCSNCYQAWKDGGFRERKKFERGQSGQDADWRVAAIDGFQNSQVLPRGTHE